MINIYRNQIQKLILLKRFYLLVIAITSIALIMDYYLKKYINFTIEAIAILLLMVGLLFLHMKKNTLTGAYFFLLITSLTLFSLIYTNHFATLSLFFAPLLPLATLLFLGIKRTLYVMLLHIIFFGILLYVEWQINPLNPLLSNQSALFNLIYALIIIYLFGIFYHFFILKTFEDLENANKKNSLLLGEVHHRVKNNLNVIASILGLQAASLPSKEKTPLLATKTRIEAMGMVHEMLYQKDQKNQINVNKYLQNLSQLLMDLYGKNGLYVSIESNSIELPLQLMFQLGIITNELFTNSLKHAFEANKGTIHISLRKDNKNYLFSYDDNGKGVENLQILQGGTTLGYKLINLAVKQLQGKLTIKHKPYTTYTIEFPYV